MKGQPPLQAAQLSDDLDELYRDLDGRLGRATQPRVGRARLTREELLEALTVHAPAQRAERLDHVRQTLARVGTGPDTPIPGDKLARDGHGSSRVVERGPNLHLSRFTTLEGVVGAVHRNGDQLLAFQLIDSAGSARWVKPTQGEDLTKELRGDLADALLPGNHIRIQNREVHILSRPQSQDRGR
jgi:hypothetical protein